MKFKFALGLSLAGLSILAASCSITSDASAPEPPVDPVRADEAVFDCYAVNYAWGYRLSGFYIDRQGNVFHYRYSGSPWKPKPIRRGSALSYAAAELRRKFTDKTLHDHIEASILTDQIALIDNAAAGSIAYRPMPGADQERNLCVAYRYDASENRYEQIELGSYGPTQLQTVNSTPEARKLLQWLISIHAK